MIFRSAAKESGEPSTSATVNSTILLAAWIAAASGSSAICRAAATAADRKASTFIPGVARASASTALACSAAYAVYLPASAIDT